MASYLDKSGLTTLWSKIKNNFLSVGGGTLNGNLTVTGTITGTLAGNITGSSASSKILSINNTAGLSDCLQYLQTTTQTDGNDLPSEAWWHVLKMNHGNGDTYYKRLLAFNFHSNMIKTGYAGGDGVVNEWVTLLNDSTGLLKSGGTMTGTLTLAGNKYTYGSNGICGLNANNSDIAKVNGLYFADSSEDISEGINFYRTASTWDNMTASAGTFYFGSNVSANATLVGNAYLRAAEYTATNINGFRHAYGDAGYGVFTRNDGNNFYLMLTNKEDPLGGYNNLRPITMSLSTGNLSFGTVCSFSNTVFAPGVTVHSNSYPGIVINNASDTRLALLYSMTSTGGYADVGLRVHSSASAYAEFTFSTTGVLTAASFNGNASSATYANSAGAATKLVSNSAPVFGTNGLEYFNASLTTSGSASQSYAPSADWWHILRMNHGNANGYYVDIGACFHKNHLAYRRVASGADSGWVTLLDTGNYKSNLYSWDANTATLTIK